MDHPGHLVGIRAVGAGGAALHRLDEVAGRRHREPQHIGIAVVPVARVVDADTGSGRRKVEGAVRRQAEYLGGAQDRAAVGVADLRDGEAAGGVDRAVDVLAERHQAGRHVQRVTRVDRVDDPAATLSRGKARRGR